MEDKYILQFGSLAGWPYKIAKELRTRGINSKNVVYYNKDVHDLKRNLPFDESIYHPSDSKFTIFKKIIRFIKKSSKDTKLVHYHGSNIFFRELHHLYEGKLFHKNNIPMLITFGGGDVRNTRHSRKLNPYFYVPFGFESVKRDFRIFLRHKSWNKYLKYTLCTPEFSKYMEPYFEKVFIYRQPVNLDDIECRIPDANKSRPKILHIPTEPLVKGTKYIVEAVEKLKNDGYDFEFVLKRQLTQEELYREIVDCDIYVDELRCGSHGVTAIEAMCAGKPTLTYIREDLVDNYPEDLPIVNANPDTIYDVLKDLITDSQKRHNIGEVSRKYVEKYHDIKVVVDNIIKVYEEILGKKC
ncbi:glycosyltransferase [Arcobacter sp. LA11]|uniref:glycosyltransferase n=1 Tax=Arcobacter sp. LA11 TaxID=1898176 RepID=UPI00093218E8|nr:glycosyltransferase [Arcobacter sp. LA11]